MSRSTAIAQLANSAETDASSSLQLSSGLYALALRLGREDGPVPAELAAFLGTKLAPAIEAEQSQPSTSNVSNSSSGGGKEVLEDVLIDVVWQLGQDLDNGLLEHLVPPPPQTGKPDKVEADTMEVDSTESSPVVAVQRDEVVAKERAARVAAVQGRLAGFTAALIVSKLRPHN